MRYYYIAIKRAKINCDNTKCCQECRETGSLTHRVGMYNSTAMLEYSLAICLNTEFSQNKTKKPGTGGSYL
jgi:hypothetical protein